ncbi:hypothetical protein Q5P01_005600 [Channa striata]|uniref:Rho GTPase-activating protein 6 n=1 Tax=Channa striata TaxID=64152 RepID=A0AA88NIY4_CHASR|nr:hypothetical protein Q5P01_005600 [Channa striata]
MSAAQGLLNSVFSCSSPASKAITKRRLRQTRSLDPAIIRHCGTGVDEASGGTFPGAGAADAGASPERLALKPALRTKVPTLKEPMSPSLSSPSIPLDLSPSSNFHFDYDIVKRAKRNTAGDLPFLVRGSAAVPSGSAGTLFSPRRWLQRKVQPSSSHAYVVWKSEVVGRTIIWIELEHLGPLLLIGHKNRCLHSTLAGLLPATLFLLVSCCSIITLDLPSAHLLTY